MKCFIRLTTGRYVPCDLYIHWWPFQHYPHRYLREIDCSLAIIGGPSAGAKSGGKSIHWTCMWRQKVLHSGCCGFRHNYYSQQRQASRANEQSTSHRFLWLPFIASLLLSCKHSSTSLMAHSLLYLLLPKQFGEKLEALLHGRLLQNLPLARKKFYLQICSVQ